MAYYPVFLQMKGLPCLVIGAGDVATQKAKALLSCGAKVEVVSPTATRALLHLVKNGAVRWRRRRFQASDLKGMRLVVAATSDQEVNRRSAAQAKKRGLLINVVDQPKLCSFIVPSVVRRGQLTIAVSTGGASPALSKWIRKDLEKRYGAEFGRLVSGMARVRGKVLKKVPGVTRRKAVFEKALQAYFKALQGV